MSDTIDRHSADNHGFMSPLPRIILISGWAHDSSAMEDLGKCLEDNANVSSVSTGDLWSAEKEAGFQSPYARNLAKMIEKNCGQVFIAGWSLGGMIALETAAYRPGLVTGLILVSTTPKFCSGPNWMAGVPPGALRAMKAKLKHDPRSIFEAFFQNVALPSEEKNETITLKIEKACAMNPLELSAGLEYLSETDLRNEATKVKHPAASRGASLRNPAKPRTPFLPVASHRAFPGRPESSRAGWRRRVNIPALILHGKQDAIIPVEAGLALKNLLPVAKIRVYENCGHGLPWQNAQQVADDIMRFIESLN